MDKKSLFEKLVNPKIVKQVTCLRCGESHDISKGTYFSVFGDICAGASGGIVGHNFDKDGNLAAISIFCHDCLIELLKESK